MALDLGLGALDDVVLRNVYFDTCVYHAPGIRLLTEVIPAENILFASEMVGAVRSIDPATGHHFDDTRRYVESAPLLDEWDRDLIYSGNALKVFPRLGSRGSVPTP
jgi:4-oxalmesaconate hydratase